jgi:hypothetical protein
VPQVIPVVVAAFQTAVTWVSATAASATLALTGSAVASAFVGNAVLAAGGMLSASVAAGAPLAAATGALLKTAVITGLMKAISPKPKNLNGGAQIRFGPNPQAPRPFLFGRTGTAGTPVVATTHGTGKDNNKWLTYIVALSAFGPVQSIEALALNGVNAPTSNGMVVSGQYANKVWNTYRNGEWTQVWTPTFGPSTIPEWTPNHRGAGIAHACLTYEYDPNVFTGGAPAPVWTVQGSTSIYNASTLSVGYSGNPADVYYTILRGIQSPNGTRLGVGLAAADIDQAKIAAWRAVCVANNWTVGGVWQVTAETPADVLRAVLQAGGAEFAINDGKASVDFFASAASAYTIRESDLAGDPVERPSTDRKARVSRIIPRFRSEADGWDLVPAAPVVDTTLDTQDGNRRRTETMDFPYVPSAQQARQLAAYNLRARRSPVFELPIKPHGAGIPSGARVTLDLGDYGISSSTCVVIKNDATATEGGTLTVRADPSDLHTWALGQDGSTVSAGSMPRDSASVVQNVDAADWTAEPVGITSGSSELPIIRVSGTFPNPTLARLDIQVKPNVSTDWIDTTSLIAGTAFAEIRGLTPTTVYNIRARYVTTGGVASPSWTNFADVTTGVLAVETGAATTVPWSGVTGAGRPADNATVGGRVGVNIFPSSGSTPLPGTQLLNDQIGIDANGRLTNTGTGSAVVGNAQITVDANGRLTTTGTGSVVVDNSKITLGTLGFTGATDATRNGVSTGLLAARPTGSDGDLFFATDDNNGAGLLYTKIAGAWVADPKAKVLFDNLTTTVNANEAINSSFRSSQTTNNSAQAASLTTLEAQMANTSGSGLQSRISTEESARASADSALATRATTLESQMANTSASGLRSRIATEESTRASADSVQASQITTLSATVNANPNLFPCPTPINNRTPTQLGWAGTPITSVYSSGVGGLVYYRARASGGSALNEAYHFDIPEPMTFSTGQQFTFSCYGYAGSATVGDRVYAFLEFRSADNSTSLYTSPAMTLNSGATRQAVTGTFPGSFTNGRLRVIFIREWPSSGSYQDVVFNMLKVECGPTATAFTNSAQVQTFASTSIDAYGRAYAISGTQTEVNGRKGGFVMDNNGVLTNFQITADDFRIYQSVGGSNIIPFRVVGGQTQINDALVRTLNVIPDGGGPSHRVQLRPNSASGADGASFTFSPAYGGIPLIRPVILQPPALAAGETYDISATSLSPSGFTIRAKKFSPGTPTSQSSGAGSNVGGTPQWRANKPTAADADGNSYTYVWTATLDKVSQEFFGGSTWYAEYYGEFDVYYNSGSTWVNAYSVGITFESFYGTTPPATVTGRAGSTTAVLPAIGQHGGEEFGLHPTIGAITAFAGVTYTTTTQSSVTSLPGNFTFDIYAPT